MCSGVLLEKLNRGRNHSAIQGDGPAGGTVEAPSGGAGGPRLTSRSEASPPGGWLDTITKRAGLKGGETPTERGWLGEKLKAEIGGGCHTLGTDPVASTE